MWTSPSYTRYQAIVAYFINGVDKRLVKVLLTLQEHKGSHLGEAQGEVLINVLDEY